MKVEKRKKPKTPTVKEKIKKKIERIILMLKVIFTYVLSVLRHKRRRVSNSIREFSRKNLRPFIKSKGSEYIVVPYVFVLIKTLLSFTAVGFFLYFCYAAAIGKMENPAIVLTSLGSVIGILVIDIRMLLKTYNEGRAVPYKKDPKFPKGR